MLYNSFKNLLFTFKSYVNKEKNHDIIRLSYLLIILIVKALSNENYRKESLFKLEKCFCPPDPTMWGDIGNSK